MSQHTFGFGTFAICYLFSALCGLTMQDMLVRTFLSGVLPESWIPVGVACAVFMGFMAQCRWLLWDDKTPSHSMATQSISTAKSDA